MGRFLARREVPIALIALFGCIAFVCCVVFQTYDIQMFLSRLSVVSLWFSLLLAIAGMVLLLNDTPLQTVRANFRLRSLWFWFGFIALLLIMVVPTRRGIIFWDEHIYMQIGQSIAQSGAALVCHECNAENGEFRLFAGMYNKEPNGYPFYLSLFFSLFRVSEGISFFANSVAYLIAAVGVVALSFALFKNSRGGFFAGLGFCFCPLVLHWSGTNSAEISTAAFTILALLGGVRFIQEPSVPRGILAAGLVGLGINFRPECLLLLLPLIVYLALKNRRIAFEIKSLWLSAVLSIPVLIEIVHMLSVRHESWGSAGPKFSLEYFSKNVQVNLPFLFNNAYFPATITLFAIYGFVRRGNLAERAILAVWFLWTWGIFLFFYAGSYEFGADDRFSILCTAPLAILCGRGLELLIQSLSSLTSEQKIVRVVFTLFLVSLLPHLPFARAAGFEAIDARLDAKYSRELAKLVPPDAIVLSHVPSYWTMLGLNSALTSYVADNPDHIRRDFFARYQGGVFFHWGYWCNVPDPPQNRFCDYALQLFNATPLKQFEYRGFRSTLYKLELKTDNTEAIPKAQ